MHARAIELYSQVLAYPIGCCCNNLTTYLASRQSDSSSSLTPVMMSSPALEDFIDHEWENLHFFAHILLCCCCCYIDQSIFEQIYAAFRVRIYQGYLCNVYNTTRNTSCTSNLLRVFIQLYYIRQVRTISQLARIGLPKKCLVVLSAAAGQTMDSICIILSLLY